MDRSLGSCGNWETSWQCESDSEWETEVESLDEENGCSWEGSDNGCPCELICATVRGWDGENENSCANLLDGNSEESRTQPEGAGSGNADKLASNLKPSMETGEKSITDK